MKYFILLLLSNMILVASAQARETMHEVPIKETMNLEQTREKLDGDIRFYFGGQKHGKVTREYGTFSSNKKTNAFNKSDTEACQWAFLSAMMALQDRARREGGNAVINIRSNYDNKLTSSTETFKCGAGNMIAGVALKGTVVTLK